MYGAHIFHTKMKDTWDYINQFATFNNFVNSPVANYHGHLYNLPFNMNTFHQLWGVKTSAEAKRKINDQELQLNHAPKNLKEQALSLGGPDIYNTLVKGYTEKQWCSLLKIYLPLLFVGYHFNLLIIIITSMILIREFQSADIHKLFKRC